MCIFHKLCNMLLLVYFYVPTILTSFNHKVENIWLFWWTSKSFQSGSNFHPYQGYQEDDIDPNDPSTFRLVIGHQVLDENGVEKLDHKYVFAPDGNQNQR